MKFFLWAIVIYLIYRLIFDFIVPVSKVSSQIRTNVKNMQQQQRAAQEEFMRQQQQAAPKPNNSKPSDKSPGEYIEFEEVK